MQDAAGVAGFLEPHKDKRTNLLHALDLFAVYSLVVREDPSSAKAIRFSHLYTKLSSCVSLPVPPSP